MRKLTRNRRVRDHEIIKIFPALIWKAKCWTVAGGGVLHARRKA